MRRKIGDFDEVDGRMCPCGELSIGSRLACHVEALKEGGSPDAISLIPYQHGRWASPQMNESVTIVICDGGRSLAADSLDF